MHKTEETHRGLIGQIQDDAQLLASKEEVEEVSKQMKAMNQVQTEAAETIDANAKESLREVQRVLEIRHATAEEKLERHWGHIRNCEELVRSKADREMVQQGIDAAAAATKELSSRSNEELKQLQQTTAANQQSNAAALAEHAGRLTSVEADVATRAFLTETAELRDKFLLCSLRTVRHRPPPLPLLLR